MTKRTKIIGHRGAAGLALENSSESLQKALEHGVDIIEFDVHLTKDNEVVVLHDQHTGRIAGDSVLVREKTLGELRQLELKNGQHLPTLDEILTILAGTSVIIDIKDTGMAEALLSVTARHPDVAAIFASFHFSELQTLRRLNPNVRAYVLMHFRPFKIALDAYKLRATGVGLNKWLLNPLTYWLLRRRHIDLYVYTVNNRLAGRYIRTFYPAASICTDYPQRFTSKQSPTEK
ncbi:MAG TPA: glycerophosphodiester phosphodiesterase family protein [Candidatus Saccharimonadales bacterium]|nr:glycerophosphodiester phosphodiesterase family protein [Candidatus Saccharimonadales bacterium]